MRTSVRTALLTTLAALTLASPAFAKGTKTREKLRIVGNSAAADWSFTQGNIGFFVSVNVTENDESGTAGKSETAFVFLSMSRYEIDTGNVLNTGVAIVEGGENFDFHVAQNLSSAELHVRNAIFQDDNSFTFFNVDMDLNWTATADPFDLEEKTNEKNPGIRTKTRFNGLFRDGVATGSITGKDIQWTPVPSSNAQLQFNKFGSLTVTTETP